ncbi:hypothetical protein F5X97DRAFT_317457 [Nemania serpens]|nr:hypothetical protein F5X97DRAFT_317457 [Nemania serpens]
MSAAEVTAKALQADAITQIANASTLLRNAISATIPVAPEQYMTIAIPGTVIDTRDLSEGGTFIYGAEYSAFPPLQVRQAEARLVDGLMPLSNIMVGNTGKSVARSYSRALDGLVPKKATMRDGDPVNPVRSPGEKGYDAAMTYLTTPLEPTGETPVETYIEKQSLWAEAQDAWDKAKIKAQQDAKALYPSDVVKQRQSYDEWSQANYRKYKFAVQGRWMDWVSNGHKYNVEFNFGMVDTESIMARVESSKESLRNSTIVDADGVNEVQGVNLTPKNWALLCQQKARDWFKRNGTYSLEQVEAEIARLNQLKLSYEALRSATTAKVPTFPVQAPEAPPKVKGGDGDGTTTGGDGGGTTTGGDGGGTTTGGGTNPSDNIDTLLSTAFTKLYSAEGKLAGLDATSKTDADKYKTAVNDLATARAELDAEVKKNMEAHLNLTKSELAKMEGDSKTSVLAWLDGQIDVIKDQISKLEAKLQEKRIAQPPRLPVYIDASTEAGSTGSVVAAEGLELADGQFGVTLPGGTGGTNDDPAGRESDPWVSISASFSAQDQQSTSNTSSWGMSVGGGVGWGLWSAGGSYAHAQSKSDSQTDMASCDVSVSFDALVVNINRPWLYAELFNDYELDVADNIMLSPGAERLKNLMAGQAANIQGGVDVGSANPSALRELAQYNTFPSYPTSFVVAANTTLEFRGNTQHIEDHFSSENNSGSMSVGWGPFSVSSSFNQSSSQQDHQMHVTATGCKIMFAAPQVIGWVSQILPALPRQEGFEPLVQNVVR